MAGFRSNSPLRTQEIGKPGSGCRGRTGDRCKSRKQPGSRRRDCRTSSNGASCPGTSLSAGTRSLDCVDAADVPGQCVGWSRGRVDGRRFRALGRNGRRIKSLNLYKTELPSGLKTLLVQRADHPGDQKLADHYAENGLEFESLSFEGYVDYVSDPTLSVPPVQTLDRIVTWVKANFPAGQLETAALAEISAVSEPLPDVEEEALRFGRQNVLRRAREPPWQMCRNGGDHAQFRI